MNAIRNSNREMNKIVITRIGLDHFPCQSGKIRLPIDLDVYC